MSVSGICSARSVVLCIFCNPLGDRLLFICLDQIFSPLLSAVAPFDSPSALVFWIVLNDLLIMQRSNFCGTADLDKARDSVARVHGNDILNNIRGRIEL